MESIMIYAPLAVTKRYDPEKNLTIVEIVGAGYNIQGIEAVGKYTDAEIKKAILELDKEFALGRAHQLLPQKLEELRETKHID